MSHSLLRLLLRHISRRAVQSLLFIVGVMIGVAMMVAIDMANYSATRAFQLSTDAVAGKASHQVVGGPAGVPQNLYVAIRQELGWQAAAPIVEDYVSVEELDGRPMRLLGVDVFAEPPFRNYIGVDGGAELDLSAIGRFLVQPNTVLIGQAIAQEYGIGADDELNIGYGDQRRSLTVVGVLQTDDDLTNRALAGILIADIATAQEVLGLQGQLSRIDLLIDADSAEGAAILRDIEALLPPDVLLQVPQIRRDAVSQLTESFTLNLTALSLLALVVGMFLIYNTVTFSVVQRRAELGTLRSLGVTRRQVFMLVLGEAALLSAVGAVLGLGLGIILGRGAVLAVTQTVNDLYFTTSVRAVEVSTFTLIKGVLIGVGAALFAATIPAFEATNTPPAGTSRRSELERKIRRMVPYISAAGLLLGLVGALLLIPTNVVVSITGLFAIVIGLAFLTPLVMIYAMRLLRPLTGWLGGIIGRMAPRGITRSLSRTSVSVAALMVATSVIVGVSVMVGSFRITVEEWLATTLNADIFISPPTRTFSEQNVALEPGLVDIIAETEGIARVYYVRAVELPSPQFELPVIVNAVASDISNGQRSFTEMRAGYSRNDVWEAILNGDGLAITEGFAHVYGIQWADDLTLTLLSPTGEREFQILGVYQDFSATQGSVTMGIETYRRYWQDESITSAAADLEAGADPDRVISALNARLAGRELVVQSNTSLYSSALRVFDRTFAITTALNLLATLVAFVGILSALLALQLERRREIGIMRSNGLTRRQLWSLTMWETGLMGLMAGAMAMPTGLLLAAVLTYIINQRSFGWTLSMNLRLEFFVQAFMVALVAALLAGLYPAYKMGRIAPAEALRAE